MMYYVSLTKRVKSTTCISKEKRDCSVQVSLIICDKEALRESMQEVGEDFYIAYRLNYMVAEQHFIKYLEETYFFEGKKECKYSIDDITIV